MTTQEIDIIRSMILKTFPVYKPERDKETFERGLKDFTDHLKNKKYKGKDLIFPNRLDLNTTKGEIFTVCIIDIIITNKYSIVNHKTGKIEHYKTKNKKDYFFVVKNKHVEEKDVEGKMSFHRAYVQPTIKNDKEIELIKY